MGKKFSIIIVNYKSSKKLKKLAKSIHKYINDYQDQIIIIDNSNQKSLDKLVNHKNIFRIQNDKNVGFSKAVNQGIKFSKNKIVLLLNPDSILRNNSIINTFKKITKDKNIGAIGGKIIDSKSNKNLFSATSKPTFFTGLFEFTNLKKIFPNNYFTNKFWIEKKHNITKPTKVFSLCGAYIFIRKKGKKTANYLSEDYFLYLEDLDLGYVLQKNDQTVFFDPNSCIFHEGGGSNNSKYKIVLKHWYKSRKIFFLKNLPKYQGVILYIIFSVEEFMLRIYHKFNNTPYV